MNKHAKNGNGTKLRHQPSRQYLWQRQMHELGRCIKCGKTAIAAKRRPAEKSKFCAFHAGVHRTAERERAQARIKQLAA